MSTAIVTWVDGVGIDTVPADDRGLHYGDGLFETLLIRGGQPRFLEAHLARLKSGCSRLAIPFAAESALRAEIAAACAHAPPLAVLKIIVTRGSATRRGYAPDAETPRRVVSLYETAPLSAELRHGVDLVFATGSVAEHPGLAGLKHLSRLESVWASGEARAVGAFDALLRTATGHIVSGAMSNLFIVRAGACRRRAWIAPACRGSCARWFCANATHWESPPPNNFCRPRIWARLMRSSSPTRGLGLCQYGAWASMPGK